MTYIIVKDDIILKQKTVISLASRLEGVHKNEHFGIWRVNIRNKVLAIHAADPG